MSVSHAVTLLAQGPGLDPGVGSGTTNLGTMLLVNPTTGRSVATLYPTVASFLNLLVPVLFIIAGVVLLFLLVGGGFSIIASGGNAKSVEQGKNQITTAILGFFLIFAAYWIVQIVEIITGLKIF